MIAHHHSWSTLEVIRGHYQVKEEDTQKESKFLVLFGCFSQQTRTAARHQIIAVLNISK